MDIYSGARTFVRPCIHTYIPLAVCNKEFPFPLVLSLLVTVELHTQTRLTGLQYLPTYIEKTVHCVSLLVRVGGSDQAKHTTSTTPSTCCNHSWNYQ
jgi:hypothetical protein